MDLTGKIFEHKKYGNYKVLKRVSNKNNLIYYKIKFLNSGFETEAKASNIKNLLVRDKFYIRHLLIGNEYISNKNQKYKVINIDKSNSEKLFIEFLDTGNIVSRKREHIISGRVYDNKGKSRSVIYDKYKNKVVKRKSYNMYKAMLNRERTRNAIVCEEWKNNFENFVEWLYSELNSMNVDPYEFELYNELKHYELDKNFKVDNNNLYSKDTCKIITKELNMSIRNMENCKIKLKKDNVVYKIDNLKTFIINLGYEILDK